MDELDPYPDLMAGAGPHAGGRADSRLIDDQGHGARRLQHRVHGSGEMTERELSRIFEARLKAGRDSSPKDASPLTERPSVSAAGLRFVETTLNAVILDVGTYLEVDREEVLEQLFRR